MKTITLKLSGNTKPVKEALKKAGYNWNANDLTWWRQVDQYWATKIQAGGEEMMQGLKAMHALHAGVRVQLKVIGVDGWSVIHQPSDYVPGLDYCDARGNYIGGDRIPGSAPDDLI